MVCVLVVGEAKDVPERCRNHTRVGDEEIDGADLSPRKESYRQVINCDKYVQLDRKQFTITAVFCKVHTLMCFLLCDPGMYRLSC